MSFSLKILNGDLVQEGSQLGIVYGVDKLKQDLTLWMAERYGIDRFHPGMGSRLQDYVGGIINYHTQAMVESEVTRVLDNYQKVTFAGLRESPTLYSKSELLWEILGVDVAISFDTVSINVSVANAVQEPTTISLNQGA